MIRRLASQSFDVIIIGGGVTGASIAVEAGLRGMRTLLVERHDYASERSGQFSPLLANHFFSSKKEWKQAVAERKLFETNFPLLVDEADYINLNYVGDKQSQHGPYMSKKQLSPSQQRSFLVKRAQRLSEKNVQAYLPELNTKQLKSAQLIKDVHIDQAKMTMGLIRKAQQHGVETVNYMKVTGFNYNADNLINGVVIEEQLTGEQYYFQGQKIINATGIYSTDLQQLDMKKKQAPIRDRVKRLQLIVRSEDLPIPHPILFPAIDSGQLIELFPYRKWVLITTTVALADEEQLDYLFSFEEFEGLSKSIYAVNDKAKLTLERVVDFNISYQSTSAYFGEGELERSLSGLISSTGVPLIFYRVHANHVVNLIAQEFKKKQLILYSRSETRKLVILDDHAVRANKRPESFNHTWLNDEFIRQVCNREGDQTDLITELLQEAEQLQSKYPMAKSLLIELLFAIRYESVYKPSDFLVRYLRLSILEIGNIAEQIPYMLSFLSDQLSWSKEERSYYERECRMWLIKNQVLL